MDEKKRAKFTTTLYVDLIKAIKVQAIKEDKNVNVILEELIEKYLGNKENENQ